MTENRMIPFLSDHIDSVDPDMTSLDSFLGDFSAPKTFVLIYYPRKFVMDQSALEFLLLFWFLLRIWRNIFLIADNEHLMLSNGDLVVINVKRTEEYSCTVKNTLTEQLAKSEALQVHVSGKSSRLD